MPFYAEECASMLAVTFSGGDKMMRSIVSTTHVFPCALLATPDSPEQRKDEALSRLMATHLPEAGSWVPL